MSDEMILVIPRAAFDSLGSFQGLSFEVDRYLHSFLAPPTPRFMRRADAEVDPGFKQIIPYAVFTHAGRVLSYVRGGKGGEKRLTAKRSIGIGGHMNESDAGGGAFDFEAYQQALQRELSEELHIGTRYTQRPVALLNDDTTEVGRVHLGVVHVFECEGDDIRSAEDALMDLRFTCPDELARERNALETWSQICVDSLDHLLKLPTERGASRSE
jgi:predicted NUDIX family phosphoesterase